MSQPLARALARLGPPLHVLAEDLLAAGGRIDAVAREPGGAVVAVLHAAPGEDRAALTDLAAHVGWLAARLPDWRALAPGLRLPARPRVRGLLLATHFDPRTRAAAAGRPELVLGRWHQPPAGVGDEPWIEPLGAGAQEAAAPEGPQAVPGDDTRAAGSAPRGAPPGAAPLIPGFRSGLSEADLATPPRE